MIVLNLRRTAGGVGAVLAAGFVTGRKFVLLSAILADFAGHFKPESEGDNAISTGEEVIYCGKSEG
jgi:hypothetical protein